MRMLTLAALLFASITHSRSGLAEDSAWIDATDTARVKQIGERYASTLSELEAEVEKYSSMVEEHLKKMGIEW